MLDRDLAHPRPLTRSLGTLGVLFLTLSVTTPASSVWVIVPGMLREAGTGAVWALVIAGLICVATAYVYAELSSAWPVAGGEYVMVARTLGPLAGFVMLGVNVFNNLLFPPVAALGVSAVLAAVVPGLPVVPTAIAVIASASFVAILNIRTNALITGLFLAVETAALGIVAWAGFAHQLRPIAPMLTAPLMPAAVGLAAATPASIGVATTIAIFALNGYGAAVYFGEEMLEAPRRIAHAILGSLVLALLLTAVPVVAALAGAADLHALFLADDPFGLLVASLAGPRLACWVAAGVAIAIGNAAIACILATARFFYSSARDRCWGRPVDRWLGAIHPRLGTPWSGTLMVGGAGIACCFAPLQLLLVLSGAGLVAIYAGIALAVLVGRRRGQTGTTGYRMPLFPAAPVLTLIALGYVIWSSWLDVEEGRPGLIMTAAQIALSAAYYQLVLRRRGWIVHDPHEGDADGDPVRGLRAADQV